MKRTLSSSLTVFWKFVFPSIWILGFGAGTVALWLDEFRGRDNEVPPDSERWIFLGFWLVGSAFLIWLTRRLRKVWLQDGVLIVSDYFREVSVPVAAISRVTQSYLCNPPNIKIHLDHPTALGQRILFVPAGRGGRFSEHPITTELKEIAARTHKDDQKPM